MAPPTKVARMERALTLAGKEADEQRRLEYIAAAAKVKTAIRLRQVRKLGASLRVIEAATGVPRATVDRICQGPEPTMPERESA